MVRQGISLCCLSIVLIVVFLKKTEQSAIGTAGHFCGEKLSNVLSAVCEGLYNGRYKKNFYGANSNILNSQNGFLDYSSEESGDTSSLSTFPFKTRENANVMLSRGELRKRSKGIVQECCINSCTWMELRGYCGGKK